MQTTTQLVTDPELWNGYVGSDPAAGNYHRWVWRAAIERTFGHEPYYLAARCGRSIQGVLPLFLVRSSVFGNRLVSMPFFSYGGVLARTDEARAALLDAAIQLASDVGARQVELRQGHPIPSDWAHDDAKVTMLARLPARAELVWQGLNKTVRNRIRFAEKHGLTAEWGGSELAGAFHTVFAANMRDLGTPAYPRSWFENLCACEPANRILIVREAGRPAFGAFLAPYADTLELPWAASMPEPRRKYSQAFLYWQFFEWAVKNGFRTIDLGRCTRASGPHGFKRHWNCEEVPLIWYYWLRAGASMPRLHADNPRYRWPIAVWKRLPLAVANRVGPMIVRSIP